FRASWICPVDSPPIPNAAVAVCDSKIISVGKFADVRANVPADSLITDLGDGAIVPGLVNAHTHLEFSHLSHPLGQPGIEFTDWIRLIVNQRSATLTKKSSDGKSHTIQQGIEESLASGVWTLGEIATAPIELSDYRSNRKNLSTLIFMEQLGRGRAVCETLKPALTSFLASAQPLDSIAGVGASPHAPYSVGAELLPQMVSQATTADRPVAMHLAETLAEREFVEHQTGKFVELMKDFGIWDPSIFAIRHSILETLKILASASSAIVVHGNYLNDQELDLIAEHTTNLAIAFCPRTHQFFGHSNYPLEKILARKINLCVGTDSRASSPDLNLYSELQQIAGAFPALDAGLVLSMGTANGAHALGIENERGTLSTGKTAALSLITPAGLSQAHPHHWMFTAASRCQPVLHAIT
ncbi:MAG: cytosine/adenosine deaminase-related metal-dependent hydrolase, partial [Mariniblastus sp.]